MLRNTACGASGSDSPTPKRPTNRTRKSFITKHVSRVVSQTSNTTSTGGNGSGAGRRISAYKTQTTKP